MPPRVTNWAGNVVFAAHRLAAPASLGELQDLVAASDRVRVLGAGHSFNRIADTPVCSSRWPACHRPSNIDPGRAAVTRRGRGAIRGAGPATARAGYALPSLASLPHLSVAGACATATHGSGDANGNLATGVSAIELIAATGELVALRRDADGDAVPRRPSVSLGALGVVTRLTLDVVPAFEVRQYVYKELPASHAEQPFR